MCWWSPWMCWFQDMGILRGAIHKCVSGHHQILGVILEIPSTEWFCRRSILFKFAGETDDRSWSLCYQIFWRKRFIAHYNDHNQVNEVLFINSFLLGNCSRQKLIKRAINNWSASKLKRQSRCLKTIAVRLLINIIKFEICGMPQWLLRNRMKNCTEFEQYPKLWEKKMKNIFQEKMSQKLRSYFLFKSDFFLGTIPSEKETSRLECWRRSLD